MRALAIGWWLSGCVVHTSEPPALEDGTVLVGWEVGASGCEAAGVVDVVVAVGEVEETFACEHGEGELVVPAGRHDVRLDGLDVQGTVRYGGTASVDVASGGTATVPTVLLSALPADLVVTWWFENGRLCSANEVEEVEIAVFEDDWLVASLAAPCADGAAELGELVAGSYDVRLLARDADGVVEWSGAEQVDLGKGEEVVMEIQLLAD